MKTEILKCDSTDNLEKAMRAASDILKRDGLVVFPTETVYGIACPATDKALEKLDKIKSRDESKRYTLHIGDKQQTRQFIPLMSQCERKLIESAWPGPLTIVFDLNPGQIEFQKKLMDSEIFSNLYKDSTIGIRCVDNPIAQKLIESAGVPIVAPSANPAGTEPAINAQQAYNYLSGKVDLIVDGGTCKHQKSSTVIKLKNNQVEVLRKGYYNKEEIQKMLTLHVLFVCTGNTCRSPMAESFCRKYISEKLNCEVDEINRLGYKVDSAGTTAGPNMPASPEVQSICSQEGIDVSGHKSQTLTAELIRQSDFIFSMTQSHLSQVEAIAGGCLEKCKLLSEQGDIPDPIGGGMDVYIECAKIIKDALKKRISEIM